VLTTPRCDGTRRGVCSPKRDLRESLWLKSHPMGPEAMYLPPPKPTTQPRKYPTRPTHIHPHRPMMYPSTPEDSRTQQVSHRLKRRWSPATLLLQIKTHTNKSKPWKTTSKVLRNKSKPSLKMSWCTFAKKMSDFGWCRSK
jgi:hypothetical protein